MKTKITKATCLLLAIIFLVTSCTSTTKIISIPAGAKVYINGESVGVTPYIHQDKLIVGSDINVKLEKEGYEPFNTMFSKDEEVNIGAIVGGCFLVFPWLWAMQYKPTHTYELIPLSSNPPQATSLPLENQKSTKSKADKLRELKQLFDEKLITQEEYDKQRQKILDEDSK